MGNLIDTNVNSGQADIQLPQASSANKTISQSTPLELQKFPRAEDKPRLSDYEYFNHLLMGEHFEAFSIRVDNNIYGSSYGKLKWITANFAGLLSRVCADMLFSEPLTIKVDEDGDQEWLDAWADDNRLNEQLYESAIDASALGDACFKLRVGKRHPDDENKSVILEEFTPTIYFPELDGFNIRGEPLAKKLEWTFQTAEKKKYLRQEIHTPGKIEDHVYELFNERVGAEVDLSILGIDGLTGVGQTTETGVNKYLVFHIPNYRTGNRYFGISDYYDLDKLFYALDNRLTKIDNILDKHSDPILMVPDGVLDENGQVKREQLHMIEVPEAQAGGKLKPEYIVWNANLEAAFLEIEKIISVFMMTAEITPDILGMGEGLNDSGRALKFKLMRTIAKAQRKKLYFDRVIKEMVYVAQLLADKWNLGAGEDNVSFSGKPQRPELDWQDGLPIDDYEEVDNEVKKIDAGIQSKKDAIMNLEDVDEDTAEEKLEAIQDENKLSLPYMKLMADQVNDNGDIANPANSGNNMTNQNDKKPGAPKTPKAKEPKQPQGKK